MSRVLNFSKGFITGAMVGAGVLMMIDPAKNKQCRKIKKRANGVARQIGNMLEEMFV